MSKFIVYRSLDEMPDIAVSKARMDWNKTGSWRSSTPRHEDKIPPCNFNCPAGEDIRGYLDLLKHGKIRDAFELILQANPLPLVCGRVCYHPCQSQCNRKDHDTAIDIRLMEKFMGEWGLENYKAPKLPPLNSKKAAVIGAGPSGLTAAYYLRRGGVDVTLYDDNEYPGGILYYGIPEFRLPNDILKMELDRVLHGIEFRPRMRFGRDIDIGDLENYDAVFLGTGAHKSKAMKIEGESLAGVESGLKFLKKVNSGGEVPLSGKDVAVIGGGNTACDVARSAYRMGGNVRIMYRRTEAEMPAFAEEIEQLKTEPIKMEFLTAPIRIMEENGGRLKATFIRMKLGEPDQSGRSSPVPISGSEYDLTADTIFAAIGEDPDLSFFPDAAVKSADEFDFDAVDKRIRDKLFLGGDILPNPRTVSHAVGSGRLAAEKIMAFLKGERFEQPRGIAVVAGPEDINYRYFVRVNLEKRRQNLFNDKGIIGEAQAVEEASRCMSCGVCYSCNNCYNFCPDMAVIRSNNGYQVNLDYCKGCGICASECPCGSLKMGEIG